MAEEQKTGRHDRTSGKTELVGKTDLEVDADTTEGLVAEDTAEGHLLEGGAHGILDLVKEGDTLGGIDEDVGDTIGGAAERPDLGGIVLLPLEVLNEQLGAALGVLGVDLDLAVVNSEAEVLTQGLGDGVDTVVLVGGLGDALHD